ncbi:MAG TPA: Maf family protein [Stellaceae bacterium]|jgi:septum formation protein|nr:Maf family protein [Stellaceae bacterium]
MNRPVVLASASAARARLLRDAGVVIAIDPADIDEGAIKTTQRAAGAPAPDCAMALAVAKASVVSARRSDALVIGGDQILTCGGEWFDKPADLAEAWAQLAALRGRAHRLATAICVCVSGEIVWRGTSEPALTMRDFSDAFLDAYVAAEGEVLLSSVGAYRLEGLGAQLFAAIEGDQFAIQGLPLIELLDFLREAGALAR